MHSSLGLKLTLPIATPPIFSKLIASLPVLSKWFSIDDPCEKNCIDLEPFVKRRPLITVPLAVAATEIAGDPPSIVV